MIIPFQRTLTDTERLDWLRLARTENVGPVTFFKLLNRFGSLEKAIANVPAMARRGGRSAVPHIPTRAEATKELEALQAFGGVAIMACEPNYPILLSRIPDPPPVISVIGRQELLQRPIVAIVGARNASLNGQKLAQNLAQGLGEGGLVVTSGLARGIDTSAHRGALDSGTIAVVAGGLDVIYPPENKGLYHKIKTNGVVVTEVAFGTEPQARHFPRRNRIIAGLSHGVVVIEAAPQSGSLITARLAAEQGRIVCAVPGSPLDPRCRGTNQLIRQGATLVESAQDVLEVLAPFGGYAVPAPQAEVPLSSFSEPTAPVFDEEDMSKAQAIVLRSLSPTPTAIDDLVRGCQLPSAVVNSVLLELELAGRLQRHTGHQVALVTAFSD